MLLKDELNYIHDFFDSPVSIKIRINELIQRIYKLPVNFSQYKSELPYLLELQEDIQKFDFRIIRNFCKLTKEKK